MNILAKIALVLCLGWPLPAMPNLHHNHNQNVARVSQSTIIEVHAPTVFETVRINRLASSLNFAGQAMPGWWKIVVLTPGEWNEDVSKWNLDTASAFTTLGQNITYLNPDYLIIASDGRLQWTLAHEAGHLICNCTSEDKANAIAKILTGHDRPDF